MFSSHIFFIIPSLLCPPPSVASLLSLSVFLLFLSLAFHCTLCASLSLSLPPHTLPASELYVNRRLRWSAEPLQSGGRVEPLGGNSLLGKTPGGAAVVVPRVEQSPPPAPHTASAVAPAVAAASTTACCLHPLGVRLRICMQGLSEGRWRSVNKRNEALTGHPVQRNEQANACRVLNPCCSGPNGWVFVVYTMLSLLSYRSFRQSCHTDGEFPLSL